MISWGWCQVYYISGKSKIKYTIDECGRAVARGGELEPKELSRNTKA